MATLTAQQIASHWLFADVDEKTMGTFLEYYTRNRHAFLLFRDFAHKIRAAGHLRYGAKSIMERVRWHCDENKLREQDGFFINNNFTTYFARLLVVVDPSFKDFFEFRTVKGLQEGAQC